MCEAGLLLLSWMACIGREEEPAAEPLPPGDGHAASPRHVPPDGAGIAGLAEPRPVVTVCPDGSADHTKLMDAIGAAPDGAVVQACAAVFTESLTIDGRDLILRGGPGTVLDLGGSARGLTVTSTAGPSHVAVQGFTITNGSASRGGAVLCEEAELSLLNVLITASRATEGGGVAATNCVVRLTRVELDGNSAVQAGGGVHLVGGTVAVDQSRFAANEGGDGGGLFAQNVEGYVEDSVFEDNSGWTGGGLWFDAGLRVARNVFARNAARFMGGGFATKFGRGEILDNDIYENTSGNDGAGGYTSNFTGHIAGNFFHENASAEDAGGLRMFHGMALIEDNVFVANVAVEAAGAMKVSHAEGEIRDNTFEDNVAGTVAGAVEIDDDVSYSTGNVFRRNHAGTDGGGVHLLKPRGNIRLDDTVFEHNIADGCGGGIAMEGVAWDVPHVLISQRLLLTGNQAARGGGICVQGGALELENAVFAGNQGAEDGGGLLVEGADVVLRNAVLYGNVAAHGSALAFPGVGAAIVSEVAVVSNAGESVSIGASSLDWRYNLQVDATFSGLADPVGKDGNFTGDPAFVDAAANDFRLRANSDAIDAGDPTRVDADGSRVDVGAFGGVGGDW
jgi:hypothetical protein